jgi:hypothetical protein
MSYPPSPGFAQTLVSAQVPAMQALVVQSVFAEHGWPTFAWSTQVPLLHTLRTHCDIASPQASPG